MSAHTPGPWRSSPYSSVVGIAISGGSAVIAGVRGDQETAEANACLIAAGPELLAALRAVAAETTEGVRPYSVDSYLPHHIAEQVRAAIAKAEGLS